jgi:cardiolipin synthase
LASFDREKEVQGRAPGLTKSLVASCPSQLKREHARTDPSPFSNLENEGAIHSNADRVYSLVNFLLGLGFSPRTASLVLLTSDLLAFLTIPSVLLQRRGRPLAALSWVLAVVSIPILGVGAWWVLGRTHLQRLRRRRQESGLTFSVRSPTASEALQLSKISTRFAGILPFATSKHPWEDGIFPPTETNSVELLVDGSQVFPAMARTIAAARHQIHAMFYIWHPDEAGRNLRDLLVQKAKDGLKVRIMVDAVGSPALRGTFVAPLEDAGASVVSFLPVRFRPWAPTFNFRNHRKLLVVDRSVAFTGGMNIGDEYEKQWHDLAIKIQGPAVAQLNSIFEEDWFFAAGEDLIEDEPARGTALAEAHEPEGASQSAPAACAVIASGPDRQNRIHDAFFLAISQARQRVLLTTPYFIPSHAILAALRGAAQRGVAVQILVPRHSDVRLVGLASRSYYPGLLTEGAQIFESSGAMVHTKALVIDDWLSVLGSANVDSRSFRLNFELACFISSADLNARLAQVFTGALHQSSEVNLAVMERRPRYLALAESLAHLLSPLL